MLKEAPRNLQIKSQKPELTSGFKYDILPELSLSGPSAFQPERKKTSGYHLEPARGFLGDWELPRVPGMPAQKPPKDFLIVPGFLLGSLSLSVFLPSPDRASFGVQFSAPLSEDASPLYRSGQAALTVCVNRSLLPLAACRLTASPWMVSFSYFLKEAREVSKLRVGRHGAVLAMTWVQLQIGFRPRSNLKEATMSTMALQCSLCLPGTQPTAPGPPRQPTVNATLCSGFFFQCRW